jgi:hypothetical protein
MMRTFCALHVLASAASAQTGDAGVPPTGPCAAVMQAQYAAQGLPIAQRPEEAQKIYDAYLNSIGQKTKHQADDSVGNPQDQSR